MQNKIVMERNDPAVTAGIVGQVGHIALRTRVGNQCNK